jgi:hypothetical protein
MWLMSHQIVDGRCGARELLQIGELRQHSVIRVILSVIELPAVPAPRDPRLIPCMTMLSWRAAIAG